MQRYLLAFLIFISLALPAWAAQNLSTDTIAHLRDYNVAGGTKYAALANGDICFVFNASTRDYTIYIYDTSSETDDDDIYVRPTGYTTSLWIKMGQNTQGTTMSASANPTMYFNSTDVDWWHGVYDTGNCLEWRLSATPGSLVKMSLDESGNLTVAGAIMSHIPVAWKSAGTTLTSAECQGGMVISTVAGTYVLPVAATVGYGSVVVVRVRDVSEVVVVDPDGSEKINLGGSALAVGFAIKSSGAAGDQVTLEATTDADGSGTDGWLVMGVYPLSTSWVTNGS